MRNEQRVEALAAAVLDGGPIDWDEAESSAADDGERELVRRLRRVGKVVDLHRPFAPAPSRPGRLPAAVDALATQTTSLGTWGDLTLIEKIGAGTYGQVYRAWDSRLDREVALKLLRPESGLTAVRRRSRDVVHEGRLLARVHHPNVVAVYGADHADGRTGIWMELVRGRTLEGVVRDHGSLGAREAILVGIELCRALSAVHAAGLVHRDIKAQNVMREQGGRIILMDFGAGIERVGTSGDDEALAGTPMYLAPELLTGCAATPQSDIYSLGTVLYHLVTGAYPLEARTLSDVCEAHERGNRRLLRDVRPDLPAPFVAAVERALAPDPEHRYATAGAMEMALQGALGETPLATTLAMPPATPLATTPATPPATTTSSAGGAAAKMAARPALWRLGITIAAAAVVVLAGFLGWRSLAPSPPARAPLAFAERDWVLIAAFENRTRESVLDGTVEYALEQELGNSRFVSVAPRVRIEDALLLMKKPPETRVDAAVAREIARRDGDIRAIVTGRIEKIGGTYVLSAQLGSPALGEVVATVVEQAAGADRLLAAVRSLSNRVRELLGEKGQTIRESTEQLEKVTTPSLRALQLYSQAETLGTRSRQWAAAEQLVRQALQHDPGFASAHNWLAWALKNQGRPPSEFLEPARRAVQLSQTVSDRERYFLLGTYYGMSGDRAGELAAYEALVRLFPDHYWGTNNLGFAYLAAGRTTDAIPLFVRSAAIRPNDYRAHVRAAQAVAVWGGDLTAAEPHLQRARELVTAESSPVDVVWLELFPAYAAWMRGDAARALADVDRVLQTADARTERERIEIINHAGSFYLALGRIDTAERLFRNISGRELLVSLPGERGAAIAALLREQPAAARRAADHYARIFKNQGAVPAIMLVARAGLAAEARRLVQIIMQDPRLKSRNDAARGAVALAEKRTEEGVSLLRAALPQIRQDGGVVYFLGCELLADALERGGDRAGAIQVLEGAARQRAQTYFSGDFSGALWLRLYGRLAANYRDAGRLAEAQAIEAEARRLLAVADGDHPLKMRLGEVR